MEAVSADGRVITAVELRLTGTEARLLRRLTEQSLGAEGDDESIDLDEEQVVIQLSGPDFPG